ncbi:MAG TPA: hypothetical protein HPP66_04705 [Planctomycetes bacterium]|nr:hypothetical protein [Planctomycetota bacterium]
MVMGAEANAVVWKEDLFPEDLIPEILELVITSWDSFEKPDRLEREVSISEEFVKNIRIEKNRRVDLPFHVWPEVNTLDTQAEDKGRTDILFAFLGTPKEEVHFVFECKRLRIPYPPPSKLATNNSEYVNKQGMMCFVTGKYSGSVTNGGMIGYVMDGRTEKAIPSVGILIKKKRLALKLAEDTGLERSSVMGDLQNVRETRHILNERKFTIHHIFLAV